AGRGLGILRRDRGERDTVAARLRRAADLLVRLHQALVERGAVGVEIDEPGERTQRELALAAAAEDVGLVAERLRVELVALEPLRRDLAGALELAGVRQRLDERAVLLAAVGVLLQRALGVADRLRDAGRHG